MGKRGKGVIPDQQFTDGNHRGDDMPVSELLEQCVRGDDDAREQFYERYAPYVRRCVLMALSSLRWQPVDLEIDDFVQEAFLKLFRSDGRRLAMLSEARCIDAWLLVFTKNVVVDLFRRMMVRKDATRLYAQERQYLYADEPAAPPKNTGLDLKSVMKEISEEERLLLQMVYIEGYKYKEIAAITHESINTIGARIRRAKAKLRKHLD